MGHYGHSENKKKDSDIIIKRCAGVFRQWEQYDEGRLRVKLQHCIPGRKTNGRSKAIKVCILQVRKEWGGRVSEIRIAKVGGLCAALFNVCFVARTINTVVRATACSGWGSDMRQRQVCIPAITADDR